jgi:hypothetical protein
MMPLNYCLVNDLQKIDPTIEEAEVRQEVNAT